VQKLREKENLYKKIGGGGKLGKELKQQQGEFYVGHAVKISGIQTCEGRAEK